MTKPRLTPWFDAVTQPPMPDRPGWYEVWVSDDRIKYGMRWDGREWGKWWFGWPGDKWRGIMRDEA
jgi:hypothetical protein